MASRHPSLLPTSLGLRARGLPTSRPLPTSRSHARALRLAAVAALLVFGTAGVAHAGDCPKPECVPGEILGAGSTIPANAPGIGYRALVGKFVPQPVDAGPDTGEPPMPGQFTPFAQILDEAGEPLLANFDDDPIDPAYKVVKPAEGLRPNRTYKIRYDKECATGSSPMPRAEVEVKTGPAAALPKVVGELEVLGKSVETRDVPNPADGGACTVKKEVSVVKVRFKPSPELLPYIKMVGLKAALDGEDTAPLKYGNANPDGTFEADVYVPCPTNERSVKAEITARVLGASLTPPAATAEVTVLACGGGTSGDGGADAGAKAAQVSGCSCDTAGQGGGAGISFAAAAVATAMVVRGLARRRRRSS
ncbi:MAG: hypothetical protein IPF92_00465 [Myxococcales bacterium]|nr:hypothetical protein [Myxococcales bacterium]HQY63605.1 hypothetical protein [Polyangiaceae bacterium]